MGWLINLIRQAADKAQQLPPDDPLRRSVCETAADVLLERKGSRKSKKLKRMLKRSNRMAW